MTAPGSPIPPQPGWWVRTEPIGTDTDSTFGWTGVAAGAATYQGAATGGYGWAVADAIGNSPLSFDAGGVGFPLAFTSSGLWSWSHTAAAGATVFADIVVGSGSVTSVTYGGAAMSLVSSLGVNNNTGLGSLYRYQKTGVPGGAQTIAVTTPTNQWVIGESVSINNCHTIGAAATVFGIAGTTSQTVTCSSGQMIVQAFGGTNGSFSSPTGGTNRWNQPGSTTATELINTATVSTTFTAANGGGYWAGIANVLT